jgi:uncharacterized protein YggL (DUF469 family)
MLFCVVGETDDVLWVAPNHVYDKQENSKDYESKRQKLDEITIFIFSFTSKYNGQNDSDDTSRESTKKTHASNDIDYKGKRPGKNYICYKCKTQTGKEEGERTYQKNR